MANVLVNENSLTSIANAIRGKNGSTDTYKPSEMAAAISAISGGSGPDIPDSAFVLKDDCSYRFANGGWDWFIENYGDKITTQNISNTNYMFNYSKITELPFEINFENGGCNCAHMFTGCSNLTSLPSIDFQQNSKQDISLLFYNCQKITEIGSLKNLYPSNMSEMFHYCSRLKKLPEIININLNYIRTYQYANCSTIFKDCSSLRNIPEEFLKQLYGIWNSYFYTHIYNCFNSCYVLDEISGLNPQTGTINNNMFTDTFYSCHRVKNIIFAKQEDGTPYTVSWKSQVIDLSNYVGYAYNISNWIRIIGFNSGITMDKQVTDDTTYNSLKNDPDWWTGDVAYSRYNHDSAVATINSLPDTSAYLATAGGTNTIKFKGAAGSATDGGAINTLTEEEIAVATAKGWTVTLV